MNTPESSDARAHFNRDRSTAAEEPAKRTPEVEQRIIVVKELRRDLDALHQKLKTLTASRETSLATTKLQESVMWLGQELKRIADTNPYPDSKDPSNTTINPPADGLKH